MPSLPWLGHNEGSSMPSLPWVRDINEARSMPSLPWVRGIMRRVVCHSPMGERDPEANSALLGMVGEGGIPAICLPVPPWPYYPHIYHLASLGGPDLGWLTALVNGALMHGGM